jgi:lipid A 3-O-deacylase PagL
LTALAIVKLGNILYRDLLLGIQSKLMRTSFAAVMLLCVSFLGTLCAKAQARPEDGGNEIELWTGGGHSAIGGRPDIGVWNGGARFGWILTRPHGPGFLKGRFEYAIDAMPVFMVVQPANIAYGAGFNPFILKWNFATRGRLVPYFELGGGVLYTNHDIPDGTNNLNFTPSAAFGTHILREKYNWSVELRYLHISNAGLDVHNSGINTVQVRLGIGKFFHH